MQNFACYEIQHCFTKWTLFVAIKLERNVFDDCQLQEGHAPRPRSYKQYGTLSIWTYIVVSGNNKPKWHNTVAK
jgi:hypothetical protein